MSTWEAVLPLRDEHKLTDKAAEELTQIVAAGVPVALGKPQPHAPGGLASDEPRQEPWIGRSVAAVREGTRVRVTVELDDSDAARVALETLRDGTCGLGLDGQVRTPLAGQIMDPYQDVPITGVTGLTCLAVVPLSLDEGEPPAPQFGSQVLDD